MDGEHRDERWTAPFTPIELLPIEPDGDTVDSRDGTDEGSAPPPDLTMVDED